MRKLLFLAYLFCAAAFSQSPAPPVRFNGYCQRGAGSVTVSGLQSSPATPVQQSYPTCQVAVYITGSGGTLATIYSDANRTALSNPFTAASDGSYFFYANDGRYDGTYSSGGIVTPFTTGDQTGLAYRIQAGTGAVNRAYGDKLYETVDVKDFGATGNGSSNEIAAFRAAYNSLPTVTRSGTPYPTGEIDIPPGAYLFNDTWTIGPFVRVHCMGPIFSCSIGFQAGAATGSTEKFLVTVTQAADGTAGNTSFGTGLDGIQFVGGAQFGGGNTGSSGLFFYGAQTSFIRNCSFNDFGIRSVVVIGAFVTWEGNWINSVIQGPGLQWEAHNSTLSDVNCEYANVAGTYKDSDGDPNPCVLLTSADVPAGVANVTIGSFWSEGNFLPLKMKNVIAVHISGAFMNGNGAALSGSAVLIKGNGDDDYIDAASIYCYNNLVSDTSQGQYYLRSVTVPDSPGGCTFFGHARYRQTMVSGQDMYALGGASINTLNIRNTSGVIVSGVDPNGNIFLHFTNINFSSQSGGTASIAANQTAGALPGGNHAFIFQSGYDDLVLQGGLNSSNPRNIWLNSPSGGVEGLLIHPYSANHNHFIFNSQNDDGSNDDIQMDNSIGRMLNVILTQAAGSATAGSGVALGGTVVAAGTATCPSTAGVRGCWVLNVGASSYGIVYVPFY